MEYSETQMKFSELEMKLSEFEMEIITNDVDEFWISNEIRESKW